MNLPIYTCHKRVQAVKIDEIIKDEISGGYLLIYNLDRRYGVKVSDAYLERHKPTVGGYYIKYQDGYESFSPAQAFEEGYTKV